MKQMHIDIAMPANEITGFLNEWIDENMPIDIVVKRGVRNGMKMVAFYVYGSTQEDALAKVGALEKLIKHGKSNKQ